MQIVDYNPNNFYPGYRLGSFASAKDVMKTDTIGDMRTELHVLLVEPFFTADEVAMKKVKSGMLIII